MEYDIREQRRPSHPLWKEAISITISTSSEPVSGPARHYFVAPVGARPFAARSPPHLTLGGQEDVGGLEIPVHDPLLVHVSDSLADLRRTRRQATNARAIEGVGALPCPGLRRGLGAGVGPRSIMGSSLQLTPVTSARSGPGKRWRVSCRGRHVIFRAKIAVCLRSRDRSCEGEGHDMSPPAKKSPR